MRIIEPRHIHHDRGGRKHGGAVAFAVFLVLIVGLAAGGIWWFVLRDAAPEGVSTQQQEVVPLVIEKKEKTTPIEFTGNEFRDLFREVSASYPNTQAFPSPPIITGDEEADTRIREVTEARGYRQTRMPVTALIRLNEPLSSGEEDDLLQPAAEKAWKELKQAAKSDNIPLALLSAYRSPEFQRNLFVKMLNNNGAKVRDIISGKADSIIDTTLSRVTVPGYSRHHTGYIIDLWCEDGSGSFEASTCFQWIKADNYLVAKRSGWIPSYPSDAEEQGPEPEPWEYAWVGTDVLFE